MSDVSQGPRWWQASDGKWYAPADSAAEPAPGWWLASDGKWYPPVEPEKAPAPDWWLASDGKWYPPENRTETAAATPNAPAVAPAAAPSAAAVAPVAAKAATPIVRAAPAPGAPVKPVPAKQAAVKPVAAKPAAGPVGKPAAAKAKTDKPPAVAKPATSVAKPVAGVANPAANAAKPAVSGGGTADPIPPFGVGPEDQIRVRNEQSKRDAAVLSGARRMAATRALGSLKDLMDDEKAAQGRELRESPAMRDRQASPPQQKGARPTPTTASAPTSQTAGTSTSKGASSKNPTTKSRAAAPARGASAPVAAAAPATPKSTDAPLLEVKQGALTADIEHLGERLAIFNDRVELQDRNYRVRQVILGPDIADVVVHKKFTGSTVTVESGSGDKIVAKGLKPDQADEIRALILKRTRQGSQPAISSAPAMPVSAAPVSPTPGTPSKPKLVANEAAAAPKPAAAATNPARPGGGKPRYNEAELVNKLTELHRAGILTDEELRDKRALVGRLARGEPLTASSTP